MGLIAKPRTQGQQALDQLAINTIRTLSMDAVQKANSGHPGMPLGAAAMAYVLWTRYLRHNPTNPKWPNRDRFVLSAGHGSMLLYSLLFLTGYDLTLEDLKQFRQLHSKTPGHPEYGVTPGVEVTTGPLGQGFANGVGMAIAARHLAACFNEPGHKIVDHYIYGICSDGDLMEGVASEAASLAGHLGLGNLIYLYDDNHVSLDGPTTWAFTEDVGRRFQAYRWHTQHVDGNDLAEVAAAIEAAQRETERPSLILARTHIGFGALAVQDTAKAHGAPLGEEEVRATKVRFGFDPDQHFVVPEEALAHFRKARDRGRALEEEWNRSFEEYARKFPEKAALWRQLHDRVLPADWDAELPTFKPEDGPLATRVASGRFLNAAAPKLPMLIGGSADLASSTETDLKGAGDFQANRYGGRNLRFGVREHAMGAASNGIAVYGLRPYAGTFLVFSDYLRPAIRLAALSKLPVCYVFTHDSIGLGEDGPTHQPVEHLMALRAIPNLWVMRPADANETVEAWRLALERTDGPTALALTRQKVPIFDRTKTAPASGVRKGGYVLVDAEGGAPRVVLVATGSEVALAMGARERLEGAGIPTRVVSLPCWELFEQQPAAYQAEVLPAGVLRVSIEAGVTLGWSRWVDRSIGLDRFGESAPGEAVFQAFGFTPEAVAEKVKGWLMT